jgi:hypothetical protein
MTMTVTINGRTVVVTGNNIRVDSGRVFVDGKEAMTTVEDDRKALLQILKDLVSFSRQVREGRVPEGDWWAPSSTPWIEMEEVASRFIENGLPGGSTGPSLVKVEGDVAALEADGSVEVSGSVGNITAGGSTHCGEVHGSITAGGSVTCGNVGGMVMAGGSVSRR